MKPTGRHLFEISFEVCNKVGGIYTVVSSKASLLEKAYENYLLIGPYISEHAKREFQPLPVPEHIQQAINALSGSGVRYHYGKWLIAGEPKVVLIEFSGAFNRIDEYKKLFWEKFGVDSLGSQFDYDEPLAFSLAAAWLVEAMHVQGSAICHAHEWMTGFALLYLKAVGSPIKTIFTTHATMLGRAICGSGQDLYAALPTLDPEQSAREHNVFQKFSAERASAVHADVFTTVSDLTANEAEKILGRKADVLLYNGLDVQTYPSFEDTSLLHMESRERLREFCMYHFFPHYTFDLNHTLFFYTSGRHEIRNKGVDLTLASLAQLNERLKSRDSKRNVVMFIFVPHETFGPDPRTLESKTYFRHIKNYLDRHTSEIQHSLINKILSEEDFNEKSIFPQQFHQEAKKLHASFQRDGDPPLSPFVCNQHNEIFALCYQYGLLNRESDRVKVVLYPIYLNGVDGILDFTYPEAVAGCHLGLFPSYYEPWGYTPAESICLGVPAVTSDLAGFGRYAAGKEGVFVLPREGISFAQSVDTYADILDNYVKMDRITRIDHKIQAKQLSMTLDWGILIERYIEAHNKAFE